MVTRPGDMQTDREKRPAASSSQQSPRPIKTRSRITAACVRCQKRKIRCDVALPACSACQRAGVPCVGGGTSRDIPRSHVNDLEARIEWLESIIREHLPSIDLNAGPGSSPTSQLGIASEGRHEPRQLQENDDIQENDSLSKISHQIGLVSITTGSDLRYLGPSSGLFFTKFVLAGLGRRLEIDRASTSNTLNDNNAPIPSEFLTSQPQSLPPSQKQARWLSQAYFEVIHLQFPFLHAPTYWGIIENMYNDNEVSSINKFQVFMVLAIGATILSRRMKVVLSAEGYYASAMKLIDGTIKTSSLDSVQWVLLLEMYALNNPTSGLSLWHLHHHGLALAIELGLHRNVPATLFSHFEIELRTRIFWCTYTIDRLLSTLLGRPMGVVDEQCDMRLPLDVDDDQLKSTEPKLSQKDKLPTNMTSAIHLFELARFNSEIKCVLYCVDRQYPPYTQPMITDAESWKVDVLDRLQRWKDRIPQHPVGGTRNHITILCEIKYHELVMLVLRPNPCFQDPDKKSIRECFSSAMACSKLYHQLYTTDSLHYGWISVHSLFMCVMVMFYCVWTPRGIAEEANLDNLIYALKVSSDLLSAMGEYWPEAKRSRDILDRVSTATIRRFTQHLKAAPNVGVHLNSQASSDIQSLLNTQAISGWINVDLASASMPSIQLEDGYVSNASGTSTYGTHDDSFISADLMSYFLGSGVDVTMTDPFDFDSILERGI